MNENHSAFSPVYLDRDIAVCIKPYGVPAQPDPSGDRDMTAYLADFFRERGEDPRVFVVHRLDRTTGGLTVYARNTAAAAALSRGIADGGTTKIYLAAAQGILSPSFGEMRDYLYHDARRNRSFVADSRRRSVKEARLLYRVMATENGVSLTAVRLYTGRTHQIRVQFASRQCPLCGDGKYGARDKAPHGALYAACLSFLHPRDGRRLAFTALPDFSVYPWNLFTPSDLSGGADGLFSGL